MKILHISIDTTMGGIEMFLLNIYKQIDREKIQFDFIEYGEKERDFDCQFLNLGAKIYKVPDRKKHPIQSVKRLEKIVRSENYSIVHIHKNTLADTGALNVCKKLNVPTIIIHSHNCLGSNGAIICLHKIKRRFVNLDGVIKFACSEKAAEWMYGCMHGVSIVKNGIDTERFRYQEDIRNRVRKEFLLENCFVIGTVGRLTEQKNPLFIIKIIRQLKEEGILFKFLWIGDGILRQEVENQVKKYGLDDEVILCGVVNNPEDYYQVMDVFIMPSLYEGFPIAAIEAQCSGLVTILSTQITKEADVSNTVIWHNIDHIGEWTNSLKQLSIKLPQRNSKQTFLKSKGYDLITTTKFLNEFYIAHA